MAIRQDRAQLHIDFITDESRNLAATLLQTKQYNQELEASSAKIKKYQDDLRKVGADEARRAEILAKIAKEEKVVADNLTKIAAEGKKVEALDLTKVAPAQLVERAKQLQQAMRLIPQSAPAFRELQSELARVNGQLATIKAASKGVDDAGKGAFASLAAGARAFIASLSLIGLAMQAINLALEGLKELFNIGQDAEALQTKMAAVFGESQKSVEDFAAKNAKAIGLSQQAYKGLATDVADLLTPMGFTRQAAADLSVELVNQAGILSRWTKGKVDTKEASEILNKALLGERDALNTLGIDIKQSLIDAELKKKGLKDLTGESLRQAEALITLEQITQQSANANAAFAKNTEDLTQKKTRLRAIIAETASRMGQALVPAFNRLLEIVVPVVEWMVNFYTRLYNIWQSMETFRRIVGGAFEFVGTVISGAVRTLGNFADIFLNVLEGNFSEALRKIKEGFVNGFANISKPAEQKSEEGGRQLATAFGNGYQAQFDIVKNNATKSAAELAEIQKKAFDKEIKEVEAGIKKQELLAEAARISEKLSEEQHAEKLSEIEERGLHARLDVYKKFKKDQENEALELKNRLLEIEAARAQRGGAAPGLLPTRSGDVTSQNAPTTNALVVAGVGNDIELGALRRKFEEALLTENQYHLASLELKRAFVIEELAILRAATVQQTDEIRKREEEKKRIEGQIEAQRTKSKIEEENERRQAEAASFAATQDLFGSIAELLLTDEKNRKKHGAAIKAFQRAQVIVAGIAETAKLRNSVADLPFPANIIVGVAQGIAIGLRTSAALAKIDATKFARGGYTGPGYGPRDSTGYRPAGIVHEHEYVVPKWIAQDRATAPVISWLERRRLRGYAEGGLVSVNTTPALPDSVNFNQGGNFDIARFEAVTMRFERAVAAMPRRVKADVVLTDLETAQSELDTVRDDASI